MERVQRKANEMIPRLPKKPYKERLKELDLFSVSELEVRGDLTVVFKTSLGSVTST